MKTEKEFSDFFVESCQHENNLDAHIQEISKNYWLDLTAHLSTYFSNENRLKITEKAGFLFSVNLSRLSLEEAWPAVVRDFLANDFWGFQSQVNKPEKKKTEEQQIFWKFFKYTWAFIQSMFIIKTAVYFFGIEATAHPEETSIAWMWLFFAISTFSLFWFAYRNRHDKN